MRLNPFVLLILLFTFGCEETTVEVIIPDPPVVVDDTPELFCGDAICTDGAESAQSCPTDCPASCGDAFCDENRGETSETCEADCGPPVVVNLQVVIAAGSCAGGVSLIQCTDRSTCRLDGEVTPCSHIVWEVEDTTTQLHVASSTGPPGERVQFNGRPAGPYSIKQTAVAFDEETNNQIHNVTVTEP